MKPLLSVVFPIRNEEEVLPKLIERVGKALAPLDFDYELIFVNDESTDRTLEMLLDFRQRDSRIKIINMSRRFGVSSSVIAGFAHAKGDAVVYLDSDLQDPPELIPTLVKEWQDGYEIVHTTRIYRRGEARSKMWLTKRAYKLINRMAEIDIPENTGDFKLLSRRAVDAILSLEECDPFMRGLSRWVGFKQTQVYYEREARYAGETKFSLWRSSNPYKELIRGITSFSATPLYISLFIGCLTSLLSFLLIIAVIVQRIVLKDVTSGWTSMILVNLFLGGVILTTIGIIGIYVGNIHQEVKKRPRYIIEQKYGIDGE